MTDKCTIYIYYKVPKDQGDVFLLRAKEVQQTIRERFEEVSTKLQKRPDCDNSNQETWMEIYIDIPFLKLEYIMTDLQELYRVKGLPSQRSTEVFIDL